MIVFLSLAIFVGERVDRGVHPYGCGTVAERVAPTVAERL